MKKHNITQQSDTLKKSNITIQQTITNVNKNNKYFEISYSDGKIARLYVLNPKMFRYYIDPDKKYDDPAQSEEGLNAKIFTKNFAKYGTDGLADTSLTKTDNGWKLSTGIININFDKNSGTMSVDKNNGISSVKTHHVILQETKPIKITANSSTQFLKDTKGSNYFGGGTQNGRFNLTGEQIKIENTNNWVDKGVASPNPFYWSSNGYGVLRYTFAPGNYDFDSNANGSISTTHNENRFDAVYFVDDSSYDLIYDYQELTGLPALTPIYGFYEAHLNAYNRDYWVEVSPDTTRAIKYPDGKYYKEYQPKDLPENLIDKAIRETLNGEKGGPSYQFSARAMIDQYLANDMPIGWFLPNDGYGAGYGQTDTLDGNLKNLANFIDYANSKGLQVGLWTQQNLSPKDPQNPKPDDRNFEKEIQKGTVALKTDVAWVGNGYSFGLNGTQTAAKMIENIKGDLLRPFILTVDGWAGTQNTAAVWTGDEYGGLWEYIRFQIPTYMGEGLSGQPNAASDMDGIYGGGNPIVNTRDYQWKAFTPIQLNMDGWGTKPKNPFAYDEKTSIINRAYLKQKTMLLPYIYSIASEATFSGKPMVRAMFLNYPEYPEAYSDLVKYQYMWGDNFLIAPIYQNTAGDDKGNDIRNGIYLPDEKQIWIDYYTGKEYQGGQVINNFAAPLWKLPVFVKAGAIIPTSNATNTPKEYEEQKKSRHFEIYPNNSSKFTVYEDDGISAQYKNGRYAKTDVTSNLKGSTLTLKIGKTQGEYLGQENERTTEINIRTKSAPTAFKVKVGNKEVTLRQAENLEEFNKSTNVYFLDKDFLTNPYLKQFGDKLSQTFLRIKLDKTDVSQHDIEILIDGLDETANVENKIPNKNTKVPVPSGLKEDKTGTTSSSIGVSWNSVEGNQSYNIKVDGVIYTNIKDRKFILTGFKPETAHTFQVQTVTEKGTSPWSKSKIFNTTESTLKRVLKNAVKLTHISTTSNIKGADAWSEDEPIKNLFDHDLDNMAHSNYLTNNGQAAIPMTITARLNKVTNLDRFVYVPRQDSGTTGMISKISVQTSIDGINWKDAGSATDWKYNQKNKEIKFAPKTKASWIRFIIPANGSKGDYVTGQEFLVYKEDSVKENDEGVSRKL